MTDTEFSLRQERYRLLAEHVSDVIWTADLNLRLTYASPSTMQLRGYTPEEAMSQTMENILSPPSFELATKVLAEELAAEKARPRDSSWSRTLELELNRKDGSTVWTETKVTFLRDKDNRPVEVLGVTRDITHRRKAAEEYAAILRTAMDGFWVIDSQGRIQDVNETYCHLTGYSREELLTMRVQDVEAKETSDDTARHLRRLRESGKDRFETRHWCKDGRVVDIEVSANYVETDGGRFFTFLRDITERKRAEKALEESRNELKAVYDGMIDGIFIAEVESKRFLRANPAICEMLGYSELELSAMTVQDIHPPGDRERVMGEFRKMVAGEVVVATDIPCLRKDGSILFADIGSSHILFRGRRCIVGFFRDVTHRRQMQEALRESEKRFRAIFDQTYQFIGLMRADGTLLEANRAALDFSGIEMSDVVGKPFWEGPWWTHSAEMQGRLREAIKTAAGGAFVRLEVTHQAKDGSTHFVDFSLKPVEDESGRVVLLIPEGRDVTERHRTEQALEESERKYRTLFTESLEAMSLTIRGKVADVNPAWLRLHGFANKDQVLGMDIVGVVHPDDQKTLLAWRNMPDRPIERPERLRDVRQDGGIIDVEVYSSEVFIKGERAILTTVRDITEHKRGEREIERLRKQIEFILGATRTGLDIIDSDFNIRYIDPEWQKTYGDPAGKKCHEYFMGRPEVCPGCGIPKALETKTITVSEEVLVKEGGRPIQVTTIPFQDEKGEWLVAEVNADITERKRAEAALQKAHSELEKRVLERTADLSRANLRLKEEIAERKRAEEQIRESEEKYRLLIENAGSPIFTLDRNGVFRVMNNTAAAYLGGSPKDFVGKTMWDLFPKDIADFQMRRVRGVIRAGKGLTEVSKVVLQGREMWFSTNVQAFSTAKGAATYVQVIAHDITERIQAERDQALLLDSINILLDKRDIEGSINKVLGHCAGVSESQCGFFSFYDSTTDRFCGEPIILLPKGSRCSVPLGLPFLSRGLRRTAVIERKVVTSDDPHHDRRRSPFPEGHIRIRNLLLLPVCVHQRVIGLIGVGNSERGYADKDAERLRLFVNQAALALEHVRVQAERERLQKALEDLTGKLMNAQEEERRRLSRDLHDGLGQGLTAILLALQNAKGAASPKSRTESLDQANTLATRAMDTIRTMAHALRPTVLDDFGLVAALRRQVKEFSRLTKVPVTLRLPGGARLGLAPAMETALFRIAQESMNNVAKHAHATKMRLELRRDQKSVRMLIADNGQGFSLEEIRRDAKSRTIGLRSIQERVKLLGGEVQVVTEIGKGTKISVAIPAKRSARPQARDEGRRKVGRN